MRADDTSEYEIRVEGHLDARWSSWFGGLSLHHESDGTTVISGPVVDRTYLLTDIHDAVRHVEAGHARGKVVVTVAARTTNIGSKEPTYS